ncbi:transposase [Escherichia coli]|nr:transposase [Escherichia coli]
MDDKQLQALANELAKNLKTPEDLSQFDRLFKKISVEAALNAELTHHLGHEKISPNREPTPVRLFHENRHHYRRADGITYST